MIRRSWLFVLIVLFALGCGSARQPPGRGENPAGKIESGIIVGLQGEAAMKRAGWRNYARPCSARRFVAAICCA